jgi:hypothetical protein
MSAKEQAIQALHELPQSASWSETEERLRFLSSRERGQQDLREGNSIPHQEVREIMQQWITR